jgi:hypothetical protein
MPGTLEWTIYFCLFEGALVVVLQVVHGGSPLSNAAASAIILAPCSFFAVFTFAVARVAVTLVGRGLPPAEAWVQGIARVWAEPARWLRVGARVFGLGALALCISLWLGVTLHSTFGELTSVFVLLLWSFLAYGVVFEESEVAT